MKVVVLNNFAVGVNHLGKAVFAARSFKRGDVITQFNGPILHKKDIPKKYLGEDDRFMQIGIDQYLGPSEGIDDLINHSCDPNAGLKFTDKDIRLIAIRDIAIGDEITWDYSTTLFDNKWKMRCDCRAEGCRKIIGDFMLLPRELQTKYREQGIIPHYIQSYMESPEYNVYTEGLARLNNND